VPTLGETILEDVHVSQLELDPENPRLSLAQRESNLNQKALLKALLEGFELEELGESFLQNGFFKNEPLLAVRVGKKLRVVEGNRRLAALRLLINGPSHENLKSARFEELHKLFKKLPTDRRRDLENPAVCIITDAKRAIGYVGFRHVTGIKQWPALEKAGYIAHLVDKYGMTPFQIAPLIGSKPAYVARHYQAYRMIMQARNQEIVDTTYIEQNFGVLMRALQAEGVHAFLKIPHADASETITNPLRKDSRKSFQEFTEWVFGTKDKKPLLPDSRRLTQMGAILQSERALNYLRTSQNPDFDQAYLFSGGEEQEAIKAIQAAEFSLRDALPRARSMKKNKVYESAVDRCADFLSQILSHFPEIQKKYFDITNG
jgi:hypothetical protein